jgi:hypothetical protein
MKSLIIGMILLFVASVLGCASSKQSWEMTQRQGTVYDYELFIKNFPDSSEAELARKKIIEIQKNNEIKKEKELAELTKFNDILKERELRMNENWKHLKLGMEIKVVSDLIGPFYLGSDPTVGRIFGQLNDTKEYAPDQELYTDLCVLKIDGGKLSEWRRKTEDERKKIHVNIIMGDTLIEWK